MKTSRIEISFPLSVEVTDDDFRVLHAITEEICHRYERSHPGRIMWPFGSGSKIIYMPMTREEELAGKHMEFDDSTYAIDVSEREDYSWPCAKCGLEQGDHKDCILEPKAGECEFSPAAKELAPEAEHGLVPMRVYLSAVDGRQKMRSALKSERAKSAALEAENLEMNKMIARFTSAA